MVAAWIETCGGPWKRAAHENHEVSFMILAFRPAAWLRKDGHSGPLGRYRPQAG